MEPNPRIEENSAALSESDHDDHQEQPFEWFFNQGSESDTSILKLLLQGFFFETRKTLYIGFQIAYQIATTKEKQNMKHFCQNLSRK